MAAVTPEQKEAEKNMQRENKTLRSEIKQMQNRVRAMQSDLTKSNGMKDRLEALCRELQKQNKFIKAESSAKIQEANEKGKELAVEVQNNMGFMKNINENLASITAESQKVRKENEELAKKVCVLQDYYEQREKILQDALQEAKTGMITAKTQLAEFNLKNAQEKEKLIKEMQQLADALEKSDEQIKEGKETEKGLRALIQNYDEKFTGLQKALQDTNGAYTDFKTEMEKVTFRTKELEKDTFKWQQRWEESNAALSLMNKSHEKIKSELGKSHESLGTMTNLCRVLQSERKDLLKKLENGTGASSGDGNASEALSLLGAPTPAVPAVSPVDSGPENTKSSPKAGPEIPDSPPKPEITSPKPAEATTKSELESPNTAPKPDPEPPVVSPQSGPGSPEAVPALSPEPPKSSPKSSPTSPKPPKSGPTPPKSPSKSGAATPKSGPTTPAKSPSKSKNQKKK